MNEAAELRTVTNLVTVVGDCVVGQRKQHYCWKQSSAMMYDQQAIDRAAIALDGTPTKVNWEQTQSWCVHFRSSKLLPIS